MQNLELLTPFIMAAYTMWATPGPNNMMLTYSGARFGFWLTLPHILGIVSGGCVLLVTAMLGLKPLIEQWPVLLLLLKVMGSIWLLLIGWKMAHAKRLADQSEQEKPMTYLAALLFQFANPKALTAILAISSLIFVAMETKPQIFWIALVLVPPLSFVAVAPWALVGQSIRRLLSTSLRWAIFTWITGGLTAACTLFLWL